MIWEWSYNYFHANNMQAASTEISVARKQQQRQQTNHINFTVNNKPYRHAFMVSSLLISAGLYLRTPASLPRPSLPPTPPLLPHPPFPPTPASYPPPPNNHYHHLPSELCVWVGCHTVAAVDKLWCPADNCETWLGQGGQWGHGDTAINN